MIFQQWKAQHTHVLFIYVVAMETLGIHDYEPKPEGAADDRITFDIFLHEA